MFAPQPLALGASPPAPSERGRWKTGTAVVSPEGPGGGGLSGGAPGHRRFCMPDSGRPALDIAGLPALGIAGLPLGPSPGCRNALRVSPRVGSPAPQVFPGAPPQAQKRHPPDCHPNSRKQERVCPGQGDRGPAVGSAQSVCHFLSLTASACPWSLAASPPGAHREEASSGEKGGRCGWTLSLVRRGRAVLWGVPLVAGRRANPEGECGPGHRPPGLRPCRVDHAWVTCLVSPHFLLLRR